MLNSALASCDDACAALGSERCLVRVACLVCQVGPAGNAVRRWIYAVLDTLHNGNGLNGPVGL